jgi:hypothetical protein
MLLATGALFILTLIILLFYRTSAEQSSVSLENDAMLAASGLAQSLLTEIQKRSFDEVTVSKYIDSKDSLTESSDLGPEVSELFLTQYDDVDDFDGYSVVDSSTKLGQYNLTVNVDYVSEMDPNTITMTKTYNKLVKVAVTSMYLPDSLKLYHIVGY